ncbi:MAG: hypothetical protein ACR2N6_01880, partial [Miltoncostaeaceae bacterium]
MVVPMAVAEDAGGGRPLARRRAEVCSEGERVIRFRAGHLPRPETSACSVRENPAGQGRSATAMVVPMAVAEDAG